VAHGLTWEPSQLLCPQYLLLDSGIRFENRQEVMLTPSALPLILLIVKLFKQPEGAFQGKSAVCACVLRASQ